jgi:hypothetical protein
VLCVIKEQIQHYVASAVTGNGVDELLDGVAGALYRQYGETLYPVIISYRSLIPGSGQSVAGWRSDRTISDRDHPPKLSGPCASERVAAACF